MKRTDVFSYSFHFVSLENAIFYKNSPGLRLEMFIHRTSRLYLFPFIDTQQV